MLGRIAAREAAPTGRPPAAGRGSGLLSVPTNAASPNLQHLNLQVGAAPPRNMLVQTPWPSIRPGVEGPPPARSAPPPVASSGALEVGPSPVAPTGALGVAAPIATARAAEVAAHSAPLAPSRSGSSLDHLLLALTQQTETISSLAHGARIIDDVEVDEAGNVVRLPGAKGASALEQLRRRFETNPAAFTDRVRQNRSAALTGPA